MGSFAFLIVRVTFHFLLPKGAELLEGIYLHFVILTHIPGHDFHVTSPTYLTQCNEAGYTCLV